MNENNCCFTGHRVINPKNLPYVRAKLSEEILRLILNKNVSCFICGGALGFDTLAAETVLSFRGIYRDISLVLCLPCRTQADKWSFSDGERYFKILKVADSVIYASDEYYRGCMHKRNRMMVDASAYCIAYLTKQRGGTFYTANYAEKKGLNVVYI